MWVKVEGRKVGAKKCNGGIVGCSSGKGKDRGRGAAERQKEGRFTLGRWEKEERI